MPPDRFSPQNAFNINLLDSDALGTPDGLQAALRAIEAVCHRGDPETTTVVEALSNHSHILEYIISVLEERAYEKLSKWVVAGFPTSAMPNIMDTMTMRLLRRFSSSLLFAEYPSAADVPPDLRAFWRKVELSSTVLKNLEENVTSTSTGGKVSPVNRRKGKAVMNSRRVDPLPFDSMGITVPTTDAEVRDVYVTVLSQLRSVLEYYLLVLRKPLLSEIFKSSYIKANPPSEQVSSSTKNAVVMSDESRGTVFPMIQPMKAALYFDDIEGFGEWAVLLSTRAEKDIRNVKRGDGAMFGIVMKKIKQLSQGHFSYDNQKPLTGPKMKLPIYEAKMTGDTRLIYTIDCIPDLRNSADNSQHECQVIRMFGIFTHAQLDRGRFWDSFSQQLQHRGPDYVERCTFRNKPLNTGDSVILPAMFPPLSHQDIPQAVTLVKVREEDMKNIHSMLVLDKFIMLSQALLNSILADREVAHVFSVSAQEQEIIEHPSSCYVIGRSGTGKTTTMLFKMLAIQRTWQQHPDMGPKPRQVFITQSRVLAMKVEEYFVKLMSSLEAAAYSPEELRVIERDVEQEIEFVDQDDNKRWRSDLPEKFSELLDEHFPLFITYDRLSTMLQNDNEQDNRGSGFIIPETHTFEDEAISPTSPTSLWRSRLRAGSENTSSSDYMQQSRRNFVSYGAFLASYWDHLPQTFTRVLDPALVFGEFMGVIKGSEETIGTKHRCLDRKSYKLLSVRSQGTFSHKRDDIYDLFLAYTKLKRQRQDYDAADRTHYILNELRDIGLVGQKVDFLYVDEVQDNLLIDTLVLRTICANQHGLFWAGDTAQTISIGSSFRFADLKAYQHRIEKQLSRELGLTPIEPRTFELVLNYRSHGGIVNCARSVIELITCYWPYSIDALQPERAIIDGFRPMFFSSQGDADLEESLFGGGQEEVVEFGADQCILVRNDATRDRLQQRLRNSIVMTLYESKGLEFNDVLLYNFFGDSTATLNQWRLVLNGVTNEGDLSDAPAFDETRHASICIELKFLYVAITRARKNLWIVDSSESAEPMKAYWSSKDQIEVWSSTAEVPRLAVASSPEEWSKTGRTMFLNKRYAQASVAFQRAGRSREAAICDAYLLREKARSISTATSAARIKAFVAAAKAFTICAEDSPSKRVNERLDHYGIAGECYSEARDLKNAGYSYWMAERYDGAARAYREGEYFDEMVDVITRHGNVMDSSLVERLTMVARVYYFKYLRVKAALKLFSSGEDALEFLEDYGLDEARVKLLEELGRIPEAADIHAQNGDILKAVGMLTASAVHNVDHARPAIEFVLAGLRRDLTLGAPPTPNSIVSKLLGFANRLDKSVMTKQDIDELAMFKAIQRANHTSLRALAKTFAAARNDPAALLCLDHFFSSPLKLLKLSLVEIQSLLSLFLDYLHLLNKFRHDESFAEGSNHQRLFGFQVLGDGRYLASKNSLVFEKLTSQSGSSRNNVDGYRCSYDELRRCIVQLISNRIYDRTEMQNNACRDVYGFSPCLYLLVQRRCEPPKEKGPCTFQHIRPEQLTADWYHARIRLILLQFQILDSARYYDRGMTNYWLGILYSALHPPYQKLGSFANLDIAKIPEGADGFRIVRERARNVCYELRYSPPRPPDVDRFGQRFMVACTLAFDLDRKNARYFLPRTPMYTSTLWPRSLFRGEGNFIVQDFVAFLTARAHRSLAFGSLYLREVLRCGLRVDLNALCDLAERLSGLFIMAYRFNSRGGALHNITLPRSWFINLIIPGTDLGKDTSSFSMFASTIIELMQKIDAQVQRYLAKSSLETGEKFIADGSRVTSLTGPLYIARICLCLCLMGYNTNDDGFKKRILTGIQSLRKGDDRFTPWIYQRYAAAESWDDLVHAFTESLRYSSFDEMILLLHTAIPDPRGWRSKYVRSVSYDRLDTVHKLLLSAAPNAPRTGATPTHPQRSHVEAVTEVQPDGDRDGEGQQKFIDVPQENIAEGKETEAVMPGGDHEEKIEDTRVSGAKTIQDAYRRYLERKRAGAAKKIQAAYRRRLKRKSVVRKGIEATQAHYWHLLRKRSMEIEWVKNSRYYLLFRVPLAYVLVCLDTIKAFVESEKKEAKKRMMTEHHSKLEELTDTLTKHSKLLKKTIELQKKLSPSSELHDGRSVSDLQRAVLEVKAVVEGLNNIPGSIGTRNQIQKRWDRGWKWISEREGSRAKGKKAKKPGLVLDHEDLLYL